MKSVYKVLISVSIVISIVFGMNINVVNACTGIRLIATDGGVIYARTMEWGAFNLHSRVAVFPREYSFSGLTPDGLTGKKWEAKYGFVGIDMLGMNYIADGMNEVGLAAGLFYHNGFAKYPDYQKDKSDISIAPNDVVNYILSNFATIDEVRKGMNKIRVVPVIESVIGAPLYAHWMVTDPSGVSIVIEFTSGKMIIHDSPLGVITNDPNYDWHMTNLRNYLKLSPEPTPAREMGDLKFTVLGTGSGMIGIPGDFTPPSRFIRAAMWTQTARPTPTTDKTIYEIFRILDNFNEPLGKIKGSDGMVGYPKDMRSSVDWTTAWDLSKHRLYYHTQNNRRVRVLDIRNIDFTDIGNDIVHLPLDKTEEQDYKYLSIKK